MAQRGHEGLLVRLVAQLALRRVTLLRALLQRRRHLVEFFRELAEFALHLMQAGARLQVAAREPQHRLRQRPHLSQNEMFPAIPRRDQRQQAHDEACPRHAQSIPAHPLRGVFPEPVLVDDEGEHQRRGDPQEDAADQLHTDTGKWFHESRDR